MVNDVVVDQLRAQLLGGAPPVTDIPTILFNLSKYINIIDNPGGYLQTLVGGAGAIDLLDTDTSFIEDDDGENYKQDVINLVTEAQEARDGGDSSTAHSLLTKSASIQKALHKTLNEPPHTQGHCEACVAGVPWPPPGVNLKLFRTRINDYKQLKTQINNIIKVYFKGAYRRDMGASEYMDNLGGFTILELYELLKIMSGSPFSTTAGTIAGAVAAAAPEAADAAAADAAAAHARDKFVYLTEQLQPILSSFWSGLQSWKRGDVARGSWKPKFQIINNIWGAAPRQSPEGEWITDQSIPTRLGAEWQQAAAGRTPQEQQQAAAAAAAVGARSTGEFYLHIINQIKLLEKYNKYCSKIIDFLDGQKTFYGNSPKNLTPTEKTRRSSIFTEILNYYEAGFGDGIQAVLEWKRLYQPQGNKRQPGSSLDNKLWANGGRAAKMSLEDFLTRHEPRPQYINNAIPSRCAKLLSDLGFKAKCFTSVIDPMGTFGDCYPVPDPTIEGVINIDIYTGANGDQSEDRLSILLYVVQKKNISLTMDPPVPGYSQGRILIKMKGRELVNISDMKIPNFAKSKPLSIANTVQLLKEHEAEHNAKQIVRKFLGDFLQGVEAIDKGLLYLSGDKPATVMYYLLNSLKYGTSTAAPYNLGGYVEKGTPCMIYLHDHTIIHNISLSTHSNLGGGGLKDKKRVRRTRKRRTNRRKKTNRKKKTQRRKTTKRRSNRRKTNKRRTVRRKNSKRRSTRRKK